MKFAKYFFASFLLLAIASAFVTPKSHVKRFTTDYYVYSESGPTDFVINEGTDSRLQTSGNWTVQGSAPSCPTGTTRICYFEIIYTVGEGQTTPTKQQILDAMATKFNESLPSSGAFVFDSGSTFTLTISGTGGVSVQYTLVKKGAA